MGQSKIFLLQLFHCISSNLLVSLVEYKLECSRIRDQDRNDSIPFLIFPTKAMLQMLTNKNGLQENKWSLSAEINWTSPKWHYLLFIYQAT